MGRVPSFHWLVAFSVNIEFQWRHHMFTTLHTAKTQLFLMRIPSLFSLNRVWRNLAGTFLKHWGTKICSKFFRSWIFPLWQVWTQRNSGGKLFNTIISLYKDPDTLLEIDACSLTLYITLTFLLMFDTQLIWLNATWSFSISQLLCS